MAYESKIMTHTPIDVKNRSGFAQLHSHLLSMPVGSLVPVMSKEIIPNTDISLGVAAEINLPPVATDFLGRVDLYLESFFVPGRLLFGGFEDVFTHDNGEAAPPGSAINSYMPGAAAIPTSEFAAGTLADYLGIKTNFASSTSTYGISNILPFVAYHLIWQEFYRDSRLQVPILFRRTQSSASGSTANLVSQLPGLYTFTTGSQIALQYGTPTTFVDGVSMFSLRQRCWGKDRFTNATYKPQQGNDVVLSAALNSGGTAAEFTMEDIFGLYTMDQWKRARNISGRFGEQQMAEFGCYPESYKCDRPIFLGQQTINIYNKSVYSTNLNTSTPTGNQNPFKGNVAAKFASPQGVGTGSLVDKWRATERGYLFVIASIVPHAYYSSGTENKFWRYRVGDFASPLLEGVGDEPIYKGEVSDDSSFFGIGQRTAANTFGYGQRFGDYKWENDKVSGLLRDGESLSAFALKRSFGSSLALGSQFIEIPTTALDDVSAVSSSSVSTFGGWGEIFFKLKTAMPLSAYTIPTLGKLRDSHTVVVENGGKRL